MNRQREGSVSSSNPEPHQAQLPSVPELGRRFIHLMTDLVATPALSQMLWWVLKIREVNRTDQILRPWVP